MFSALGSTVMGVGCCDMCSWSYDARGVYETGICQKLFDGMERAANARRAWRTGYWADKDEIYAGYRDDRRTSEQKRTATGAHLLVHEALHHACTTDGSLPNGTKAYGIDNVWKLAQEAPAVARVSADSYAFLAWDLTKHFGPSTGGSQDVQRLGGTALGEECVAALYRDDQCANRVGDPFRTRAVGGDDWTWSNSGTGRSLSDTHPYAWSGTELENAPHALKVESAGCKYVEVFDEDEAELGYSDNLKLSAPAAGSCHPLPADLEEDVGGLHLQAKPTPGSPLATPQGLLPVPGLSNAPRQDQAATRSYK